MTFAEQGLRVGTPWSVTLNGITMNGTGTTIAFRDPNGGYAFEVAPVQGHLARPAAGTVTVCGADVEQTIRFA